MDGENAKALLEDWRRRSATAERDRRRQLQIYVLVAVQAGIAAGLAWALARYVGASSNPVFAPASAVGTVAAAAGQRLRRTLELIGGVALGIGVGDGLIALFGRGAVQTGVIVTATIMVALAITGRGGLVTQAGGAAVLVSTVAPAGARVEVPQIINAVIGGLVAFVVVIALFPLNPLRLAARAAAPVLSTLSSQLFATAQAMDKRDAANAQEALDRLRAMGGQLSQLADAVQGAAEVVRYAPQRGRWHNALQQYHAGAEHLDRVVRASRGLARRAKTAIEDGEHLPPVLTRAVADLGCAVRELQESFSNGQEPEPTRHRTLAAVCEAGDAGREGLGLSGTVVMAQVRTMATDLLQATGVGRADALLLVRRAANRQPPH
ncbi:FUSC family protein [Micromonospora sp. DPT]|uniref:FUSC family protein n=1 Tax=Micromonospora sp. DPT TaxID=3142975 RepID=UPI00320A896B